MYGNYIIESTYVTISSLSKILCTTRWPNCSSTPIFLPEADPNNARNLILHLPSSVYERQFILVSLHIKVQNAVCHSLTTIMESDCGWTCTLMSRSQQIHVGVLIVGISPSERPAFVHLPNALYAPCTCAKNSCMVISTLAGITGTIINILLCQPLPHQLRPSTPGMSSILDLKLTEDEDANDTSYVHEDSIEREEAGEYASEEFEDDDSDEDVLADLSPPGLNDWRWSSSLLNKTTPSTFTYVFHVHRLTWGLLLNPPQSLHRISYPI